uniref:UDP-glucose: anthocyanidin 3-O-glucosyltransferase n=1 Tax=Freesia hybrid cultivar TaxID=867926 RepID=A0A514MHL0_9ASPA|nr:UDP-glucose: anthocyanidin 3-O-glucosyltransferase [Freesia hybrid cultivar]
MGSSQPPTRRRHVAVIAFPFSSHPAALFTLARAMAAAAPGTTFSFLSFPGSVDSLSKIPCRPENLRLCHVADPTPPGAIPPEQRIGMFLAAAPAYLRAGIKAAEALDGGGVTCLVSDSLLWMTADVAEEKGVPWVAVWTGGTSALVVHVYTDRLRKFYGVVHGDAIHPRADELLDVNVVPGFSEHRVRDLPEGILWKVDSPFASLVDTMVSKFPRAVAVVANTIPGLDPGLDAAFASKFKNYLPIGPFTILSPLPSPQHDNECVAWLDRQAPASVAYVSFGTLAALPPSELTELANGLEASGVPFLWSMKNKEALPAGFLDRTRGKGLVVDWAPQASVLAHNAVGGFVTHCGWSSVMESVAAGVPMICRSVFGDQTMTAKMVCNAWKIGFGFSGGAITREEVVRGLRMVLRGEEGGREIRERSSELKSLAWREVKVEGRTVKNLNSLIEIING